MCVITVCRRALPRDDLAVECPPELRAIIEQFESSGTVYTDTREGFPMTNGDPQHSRRRWRALLAQGRAKFSDGSWYLDDKPILFQSELPDRLWNCFRQLCPFATVTPVAEYIHSIYSGYGRRDIKALCQVGLDIITKGRLGAETVLNPRKKHSKRQRSISHPKKHDSCVNPVRGRAGVQANLSAVRIESTSHIEDHSKSSQPAKLSAYIRAKLAPRLKPSIDRLKENEQRVSEDGVQTIFDHQVKDLMAMFGHDWLDQLALIGSNDPGLGDVDIEDCEVQYASEEEVRADIRDGKCYRTPVVIPQYHRAHEDDAQKIRQALRPFEQNKVDVQDTSSHAGSDALRSVPLGFALTRLERRHLWQSAIEDDFDFASSKESTKLESFCEQPSPFNYLNLRDLNVIPKPDFLDQALRYNLIHSAHMYINSKSIGKPSRELGQSDLDSCRNFMLISEAHSWSRPHVDIVSGTWVINVKGLKIWWVCMPNAPDRTEFEKVGQAWTPIGKFKMIVLFEGDLLIMPPGCLIIHAPYSVEGCIMIGGQFADSHQVCEFGEHICWLADFPWCTNEALPAEFGPIWDAISKRPAKFGIFSDIERLQQVDRVLRARLRCECGRGLQKCVKSACGNKCKCRERYLLESKRSRKIVGDALSTFTNGQCSWFCHQGESNVQIDGKE